MNIEEICDIVRESDPEVEVDSDDFMAAVVLLTAALRTGAHPFRIQRFTGFSRELIDGFGENLRRCGVWKGFKTYADWTDEESGGIAFWCDVNVALGLLSRN